MLCIFGVIRFMPHYKGRLPPGINAPSVAQTAEREKQSSNLKGIRMVNSRSKGKRGELEAVKIFNQLFGTNFRRSQQFKGTRSSSDIMDDDRPELAVEVKRRQSFNLHAAVEKLRQEVSPEPGSDIGDTASPFVLHRKNGERWLLTADLEDVPALICELMTVLVETGKAEAGLDAEELQRLAHYFRHNQFSEE